MASKAHQKKTSPGQSGERPSDINYFTNAIFVVGNQKTAEMDSRQDASKTATDTSKVAQEVSKTAQEGQDDLQEASKMVQAKMAHEASQMAQEASKTVQETPRRLQTGSGKPKSLKKILSVAFL